MLWCRVFKEGSHALAPPPGGILSCSTMRANRMIENLSVLSLPAETKEGMLPKCTVLVGADRQSG